MPHRKPRGKLSVAELAALTIQQDYSLDEVNAAW